MSKEQITLSAALDLIAQSKSDIKGSVQFKGGTIGDDLTEYSTSINNIQFRSIYVEENTVEVPMYGSYVTIDALQYINGYKSYPTNISYTVSGSSANVEWVDNPTERGPQQFNVTPVNYGTTSLVIEDEMGNCNYPISLTTSAVTFTAELAYKTHFVIVNDESYPEGTNVLEWDGTSTSIFSLYFKVYNSNENIVIPPSALINSIEISGDAIDNNLMTITPSEESSYNEVKLTIVPTDNTLYNTDFYVNFSDGHSETGNIHIVFVGGVDPEPAVDPEFTWDGSDQNNPIQVNVNLSAFDSSDVRILPNLSAPEGIQYPWGSDTTWTPDISGEWYSNTNDFPIMGFFEGGGDFSPKDDMDSNGNMIWKDGPTTAGTYLKSYTCTFVYHKDYSEKYDETTNEQLDDPIAQALDGTVVTFWVQYNVTGAYPDDDPFANPQA